MINSFKGVSIPTEVRQMTPRDVPDEGLQCVHPAIESLPEFIGMIPAGSLNPACRNFNGSIARYGSRLLLAYRSEAYSSINTVWIAELNSEYGVIGTFKVEIPEEPCVHYEDPRLSVVGVSLYLIFAHVKFGMPNTCKQRMFRLGQSTLQPVDEIPLPFGNAENGNAEKNWLPFELPNGRMGLVYSQRPHLVIEVDSSTGHHTPGVRAFSFGKSMNGRTPPIRIGEGYYLSFFGGHVKHEFRGARYFVGAQLFRAGPPYDVLMATRVPLAWGSECSPTIFSARPGSGHPCCLFPAGIVREGEDLIVSAGVNDSYIALLRYSIRELIGKMDAVNSKGEFV
jgi:predicted GH43/DUF377 family glycosyl hydrolase